jgi:hypothetical protein
MVRRMSGGGAGNRPVRVLQADFCKCFHRVHDAPLEVRTPCRWAIHW